MSSKALVFALVVGVLASASASRDLLQGAQGGQAAQAPFPPAPPQCQNKWSPESIDCTFPCPATGNWTVTCTASGLQGAPTPGVGVAECSLKREKGQNEINFLCLVAAPSSPPNCGPLQALNAVPDPCVAQTAGSIMQGWPANATQSS